MIITITKVEQAFASNGAEYQRVTGISEGKEVTKSVFDKLKDKWSLLKENSTLDFKMVKKGQFWNVEDINPIELPKPQPSDKILPEHQKVIEQAKAEARFDPTRKSIERQTSLKCATDITVAQIQAGKEMKVGQILTIAGLFESYLENGIIVKNKEG